MSRRILITAVVMALVIATVVVCLAVVDPMQAAWFPKCPSKLVTGYDCPGCGSSRAIHAMLHGDIAAAWHFNAALFFAIPLIIFLFAGNIAGPYSRLRRITQHPIVPIGTLIATVVWTIARNL